MYYNGIRVQVLQQWKVSASNTTWGLGNKKLMVILDWKLNEKSEAVLSMVDQSGATK